MQQTCKDAASYRMQPFRKKSRNELDQGRDKGHQGAYQSCPRTKRAQNIVPCANQYKGHTNQVLR